MYTVTIATPEGEIARAILDTIVDARARAQTFLRRAHRTDTVIIRNRRGQFIEAYRVLLQSISTREVEA
jgi:hypothetical protein